LGGAELIKDELRGDGEAGRGVLDVGGSDMSAYVGVLEESMVGSSLGKGVRRRTAMVERRSRVCVWVSGLALRNPLAAPIGDSWKLDPRWDVFNHFKTLSDIVLYSECVGC